MRLRLYDWVFASFVQKEALLRTRKRNESQLPTRARTPNLATEKIAPSASRTVYMCSVYARLPHALTFIEAFGGTHASVQRK